MYQYQSAVPYPPPQGSQQAYALSYAAAPGFQQQAAYAPGYAAAAPPAAPVYAAPGDPVQQRARFDDLVRRYGIDLAQADDLFGALTTSRVVLLLDDSGSMGTPVADPLSAPYAQGGRCTRWSELQHFAVTATDIVTATAPGGVDVYFLDRPGMASVTQPQQLAPAFAMPPRGGTPMLGALQRIFAQYAPIAQAGTRVLVVIVTDGEPSDGSPSQLFQLLATQRHPQIHVSLAEMSDNEQTMDWLDGWDRQLANFDNSDDFQMERRRVMMTRGGRFTYTDYVVKVLLGSLMRKYFMQDNAMQLSAMLAGQNGGCCALA